MNVSDNDAEACRTEPCRTEPFLPDIHRARRDAAQQPRTVKKMKRSDGSGRTVSALSKDGIGQFRNSPQHKVCVELLRRGYHRSFSELYSLLIGCEERGLGQQGQDSLDALQLHLSSAEDSQRTGDWAGVCASLLSLAERPWAPEERWISLHFYRRSLEAARRLPSSPRRLPSSPRRLPSSPQPETLVTSRLAALFLQLGELDEARRYSERFLELAGASGDPTGGGPLREQAGRLLVQVYVRLAELPARRPGALELLHRAHDTAAHCDDRSVKGEAAYKLGLAYQRTGDHASALEFLTVSMENFRLLQDTDALGKTYKALSQSEQTTAVKVEYLERYVDVSRVNGHHGNLQDAYMSLGAFYCCQGQYSRCIEFYQQGYELACSLGDVERIQRAQMFFSRLAQVQGKPASRDRCYHDVSITRGVHDNHYCSVNPCFIAVVTECNGGGSFLVLPIHHTGRLDQQQPRVCGHSGRVLDVKWSPFNDHQVASCSEDCTVKIWDVPVCGVRQNLTQARKTLIGHSRRVGLIEWHPTAKDLLLSSAYDYKVCLWDVSQGGAVLRSPLRVVVSPVGQPRPAERLLLCACFSPDGGRLALTSKDRRLRLLDPRTGAVLQVSSPSYRVCKVVYLGALKMLLTTGFSCWNLRQITLWDPHDLSEPLYEEELDGTGGVLFPFFDPDTNMLYLAGKGDCNIRYYEVSSVKPFVIFLNQFRSQLPQKGLGVMPKRGLDARSGELFRFYRLISSKHLVEPVSMLVERARKPGVLQEDPYPPTTTAAGNEATLTAQQWLSGLNRGPVPMSLRPGTRLANPYPETPPDRGPEARLEPQACTAGLAGVHKAVKPVEEAFLREQEAYQDAKYPRTGSDLWAWQPDETQAVPRAYRIIPHCCEPEGTPPPRTESQLLQVFYKQQEEIRELREELNQKEEKITTLEMEIRNSRNMRTSC